MSEEFEKWWEEDNGQIFCESVVGDPKTVAKDLWKQARKGYIKLADVLKIIKKESELLRRDRFAIRKIEEEIDKLEGEQ